jgi:hypothetical protein
MGNPAKVVSYKGSFEYVVYDGMEQDPERRASLECARSEFQKDPVRSLQGIAKFTTGGLSAGSSTD